MDSKLTTMLENKEKLQAQLAELEELIRLYRKFFPDISPESAPEATLAEADEVEEQSRDEGNPLEVEAAKLPKRGFTREMLKPHLRQTILDAGRPLSRSQLLRAMDDKGIPVGGSDRPKNMGTIMWRLADDFVNLEGFGYWPADQAYHPAGYHPGLLGDQNPPAQHNFPLTKAE